MMLRTLRIASPAVLLVLLAAPTVQGFLLMPHHTDLNPGEHHVRWFAMDRPVHYQVCNRASADDPNIANFDEDLVVDAAYAVWEAVPTATISFIDDGFTNVVSECAWQQDNKNTITFNDPQNQITTPGVLGAALTWFNPACASTEFASGAEWCPIGESDILLNNGIDWIRNQANPCNNQMDVDAVVTHEIGHSLGLTHMPDGQSSPSDPPPQEDPPQAATMFWSIAPCDKTKYDLHTDDIDGISYIYPVEVCDPPEFTIPAGSSVQCVGKNLTFFPNVTKPAGGSFTYTWDFGDGTSPLTLSVLGTISHRFDVAGDFTVTCTARWNDDPNNCFFTASTDVSIAQPPAFTIDPLPTACSGWVITLQANLVDPGNGPYEYEWFFGDGGSEVVADPTQPTQHTYPTGQDLFTARLAVTHPSLTGCDAEVFVDVTFETLPVFLVALGDNGCPGKPMTMWGDIWDWGSGTYVWEWEFGDTQTLVVADPSVPVEHTYATQGPFDVTLRAINQNIANCNGWDTKQITLVVETLPAFSITIAGSNLVGQPVDLSATVTDWGTGSWVWEWEFGDGTPNQQVADPTLVIQHTYSSPGPFDVTLHAKNQPALACDETATEILTLIDDSSPTFSLALGGTCCVDVPCDFAADVSDWGSGTWLWEWEFGDATPNLPVADPTVPAQHTYTSLGSVSAVLHASFQADPNFTVNESGPVDVTTDEVPTIPVGNSLMAERSGKDVLLSWDASDLRYYNLHRTALRSELGDSDLEIGATAKLASPANQETLTVPNLVDDTDNPLYFEIHPRGLCSGTVFP